MVELSYALTGWSVDGRGERRDDPPPGGQTMRTLFPIPPKRVLRGLVISALWLAFLVFGLRMCGRACAPGQISEEERQRRNEAYEQWRENALDNTRRATAAREDCKRRVPVPTILDTKAERAAREEAVDLCVQRRLREAR